MAFQVCSAGGGRICAESHQIHAAAASYNGIKPRNECMKAPRVDTKWQARAKPTASATTCLPAKNHSGQAKPDNNSNNSPCRPRA